MPSYWQNKVFVVTGGSSGLGRAIAAGLLAGGARVAIAARGQEQLSAAAAELVAGGREVLAVPADVTRQEDVNALFGRTLSHFGRIDGLVNCAGLSMRGAVLDTPPEEFSRLLEINLLAVVRCTRAAAPEIIKNAGHIVNIGSLAGKAAARYLGAYPASKFALSGYTQQLRLELAPQGVHVLLVCSGPIARERPRTYGAESMGDLPEAARRPGAGVKTKAIDPAVLAARIIKACQRRRAELIVPASARLLFALMQLSAGLGDVILRRMT